MLCKGRASPSGISYPLRGVAFLSLGYLEAGVAFFRYLSKKEKGMEENFILLQQANTNPKGCRFFVNLFIKGTPIHYINR